jgi:16S rRNA C967 or C1407 C5-methylase (RsmB/RsmF family)
MKSITLFLGLTLFLSVTSCGQDLSKLDDTKKDTKKVKIAEDFANAFFTKLKEGSFYQFKDEAIDMMKNSFTEQTQKTVYSQLKAQFGEFESQSYAETWVQKSNGSDHIIRLKGKFSKSVKMLELRIVVNEENKLAGFWIKPWSDMLM